jgi:hypothetical protein
MNKYKYSAILISLLIFLFSCSEKYDLDNNIDNEKIVIEGLIFNHYKINIPDRLDDTSRSLSYYSYVKIHKVNSSLNALDQGYHEIGTAIPDALVIISDDFGNRDTLQHIDCEGYDYSKYGHYIKCGFKGTPNRKYFLYVKVKDKEYTAEAYMPDVPNLDSISIPDNFFENGNIDNDFIEGIKVFFDEPSNTKDYYLFTIEKDVNISTFSSSMKTLVDDKYLSEDISTNGFMLDDGQNKKYWFNNYIYLQTSLLRGEYITVMMQGLTEEAYNYQKALMLQANNDGGVYSPTPATPHGNISNGALGFFRASSVSIITGRKE